MIIIDPKEVDFSRYEGIPHLISPIITDPKVVPNVFKWLVGEMNRRYSLLKTANASNIEEYNERAGFQAMPAIVVLVEEYADIMLTEGATEIERGIQALAQKARAAGMHLVIATQRPSRDVINGTLKANIPCKVAFTVNGQVDSRVILDQPGAEKLLGKGDMLFYPQDYPKPIRIQAPMVSKDELKNLIDYLKSQGVEPEYNADVTTLPSNNIAGLNQGSDELDELYSVAKEYVISAQRASASLLQTRLSIGFNRATRLLQQLENTGVVGPQNGAKPRTVLIKNNNNELAQAFEEDVEEEDLNHDEKEFAA
jgi:S-DNA-T family DNA segregation ATPase FtsK/SpoIIIE